MGRQAPTWTYDFETQTINYVAKFTVPSDNCYWKCHRTLFVEMITAIPPLMDGLATVGLHSGNNSRNCKLMKMKE